MSATKQNSANLTEDKCILCIIMNIFVVIETEDTHKMEMSQIFIVTWRGRKKIIKRQKNVHWLETVTVNNIFCPFSLPFLNELPNLPEWKTMFNFYKYLLRNMPAEKN
jgi:hypothetical protein